MLCLSRPEDVLSRLQHCVVRFSCCSQRKCSIASLLLLHHTFCCALSKKNYFLEILPYQLWRKKWESLWIHKKEIVIFQIFKIFKFPPVFCQVFSNKIINFFVENLPRIFWKMPRQQNFQKQQKKLATILKASYLTTLRIFIQLSVLGKTRTCEF